MFHRIGIVIIVDILRQWRVNAAASALKGHNTIDPGGRPRCTTPRQTLQNSAALRRYDGNVTSPFGRGRGLSRGRGFWHDGGCHDYEYENDVSRQKYLAGPGVVRFASLEGGEPALSRA